MSRTSSIGHFPHCNVAILAGGQGTRLSSRSGDLPKPMVPVLGKPVLQHQVELCRKYGFTNIALLVHHRHEAISNFFGDGSRYGVRIHYVIEKMPRGTAGALRDALGILAPQFLLLYGDTFLDVDLRGVWNSHLTSGAAGTLLLHPNDHPQDSDLVDLDIHGNVRAILPYPHPLGREVRNLVNAALYVLERVGLEDVIPLEGKADIAKDMFPRMLELGMLLSGYVTPEYIKDMGTPERLDKVERDFVAGLPERLSIRHLRSAVFLDRDGTLIREVNHLTSPDQVELLSGVATSVRRLNRNGTLAVIITNQPVVARGGITVEGLAQVHARLEWLLGLDGAFIDGLYFCPHHPDKGFPGEVPELKVPCRCRKPQPGLIEQACQDLSIDKRNSWMIGDSTSDIEAGRRAGIRTILLRTGYAGSDVKYAIRPDYICPDLPDAVEWILSGHGRMTRMMAQIALTACNGNRLVLIGGLARAGKSFAAQVLKELLYALGREAHVVSLDGWLKPRDQRSEGSGVCGRYDLKAAIAAISAVASSRTREVLQEKLYDRVARLAGPTTIEHSIGPKDVLIVEGTPALLMEELNILPNTVKVYVQIAPEIRAERLSKDYVWRGHPTDQHVNHLAMRELDETPVVMNSCSFADFLVDQGLNEESE
jgi:histidinol-phosphate phosphatase family protein